MRNVILSREMPKFHRAMLRDDARNTAYARALAVMAPGKRVLDIGTGSGLLAMLAARAGAQHVYACEQNRMLAETAREIVAANGLADRITVFSLPSAELDSERDLGGGVDLVVSEILSDNVFGEGVIQSLEDARRRLCLSGAHFLPTRVTARISLANATPPDPIGMVQGFDLSLFERHLRTGGFFNVVVANDFQRGSPADLLTIEFDHARPLPRKGNARVSLPSPGGTIGGVLQWLRIETSTDIVYENAPAGDPSLSWSVRYVRFAQPRETLPGELIDIEAMFTAEELLIWDATDSS